MIEHTDEQILEAIKGSECNISEIAQRLGVSWYTGKERINRNEITKRAFQDEREATKDLAEKTVLKSIKNGNTQDAKWWLSTIGKDRGFTEKQEIQHSGELEQNVTINIKGVE